MPDSLDSMQMNARLDEMFQKLDQNAKERHATNGKTHVVLNTIIQKTENQDTVLNKLVKDVSLITDSVKRIEVRMVGDEALKGSGFIQEQTAQAVRLGAVEGRVVLLETGRTTDQTAYLSDKRSVKWVVIAIGFVFSLINWAISSGVLKFPWSNPRS